MAPKRNSLQQASLSLLLSLLSPRMQPPFLLLPTHRCKARNEVVLRGRVVDDVDVVVVNHAMIVARYGRPLQSRLFGFPPGFFLLRPHLLLHHGLQLRGGGGCCCFRGC